MMLRSLALAALTATLMASPMSAVAQTETPPAADPAAPPTDAPAAPGTPAAPPTTPPAGTPAGAPPPAAAPTAASVDENLTKLFGDAAPFKEFLASLQKEAADGDKKAVAKMVRYPLKTKVDGKDTTFEKEADLVKAYDDVFTPKILTAIKDQTYEKLFANDMGVMIGSGQVWFGQTGDDKAVKIIGINQDAGS